MVQSVRIRSVKHHKIVNFFGIEEFYDACRDLHSDEADPALMFQDLENIPSALIGESWLAEDILEIIEAVSNLGETEQEAFFVLLDNSDRDIVSKDINDLISSFEDDYQGKYNDE